VTAPPLAVVSLCSGYGGLDDAAVAVFGGAVVAYAETDPAAVKVLERVYPGVPNAGDITAADWAAIVERFGLAGVDVLCAGFPCQPASSAGKRLGAADERWIWPDVARAVRELGPAWVVLENVDDLLVRDGGALIAEVTAGLRAAGYAGAWVCVKASEIGAPHERDRVFIVARRAGPPVRPGWAQPFAVAEGQAWAGGLANLFDDCPPVGRWPRAGTWDGSAAWPRPLWAVRFGGESRRGTLFPTPAASVTNDGESLASWESRRDRLAALGYNGNGMGTPLAIAVQRLGARRMPTPAARDVKGGGNPVGRVRANGRVRGPEDWTLPDLAGAAGAGALLPTPRASAQENRTRARTPSQNNGEHGRYLSAEVLTLFPTPMATNDTGARPVAAARTHDGPDHGPRLQDVAALLPTAVAQDAGAARSAGSPRRYGGTGKIGYTLTDRLAPRGGDRFAGWGPYAAAVERWEAITGRPAPCPVMASAPTKRRIRDCAAETGLDGYAAAGAIRAGLWGAQLDPLFSEWLMGIPPGRVTAVPGLSRNERLRLIGNGVVTLQAAAGVAELARELGWDR
jgi:DNA (cytosine-5)-methyltransferase 1